MDEDDGKARKLKRDSRLEKGDEVVVVVVVVVTREKGRVYFHE